MITETSKPIENPEENKENLNTLNTLNESKTTKPNTQINLDENAKQGQSQGQSQSLAVRVSKAPSKCKDIQIQLPTPSSNLPKTQLLNYMERENSNLIKVYGAEVYHYTKYLEAETSAIKVLEKHKITPEIRTKMIDWMLEVLNVFKSEEITFFLAVHIMDLFIYKCNTQLSSESVHLIGITSMFIASKFEDVIPLRLNNVTMKIGHNLFTE